MVLKSDLPKFLSNKSLYFFKCGTKVNYGFKRYGHSWNVKSAKSREINFPFKWRGYMAASYSMPTYLFLGSILFVNLSYNN